MKDKIYNVLFLCTGNSARSIMAEVLLNNLGHGRFRAYSAGSHPAGYVHPLALELLESMEFETGGLRSKSWDEFARPDLPPLDFAFTVCDKAAGEVCPVWPGQPMTAHWGIEDPAAFEGPIEERRRYFARIGNYLRNRIVAFTSLPLARIDSLTLQHKLQEIGTLRPDES